MSRLVRNSSCPCLGSWSSRSLQTTKFSCRPTSPSTFWARSATWSQSTWPATNRSMSLSGRSDAEANEPKMNATRTCGIARRADRSRSTGAVSARRAGARSAISAVVGSADHRRMLPSRRLRATPASKRWLSASWTEWTSEPVRRAISRVWSSAPERLERSPSTRRDAGFRERIRSSTGRAYIDRWFASTTVERGALKRAFRAWSYVADPCPVPPSATAGKPHPMCAHRAEANLAHHRSRTRGLRLRPERPDRW